MIYYIFLISIYIASKNRSHWYWYFYVESGLSESSEESEEEISAEEEDEASLSDGTDTSKSARKRVSIRHIKYWMFQKIPYLFLSICYVFFNSLLPKAWFSSIKLRVLNKTSCWWIHPIYFIIVFEIFSFHIVVRE